MTEADDPPGPSPSGAAGRPEVGPDSASVAVPVLLGLVSALLVGASTASAVLTGHEALGVALVASAILFVAALAAYEAGRRVGERSG